MFQISNRVGGNKDNYFMEEVLNETFQVIGDVKVVINSSITYRLVTKLLKGAWIQ